MCVCVCAPSCVCMGSCLHPEFQLRRSLHCSVFSLQTLKTYHLIRYDMQCEWVRWLLHHEDTLLLNFCFVGSYRILVQISDTILSFCSTFLCFYCCVTSSDWVAELITESHIKPCLYSCDTSTLYRSFRCTHILPWHFLLHTKIQAVYKMLQTSLLLLCILFSDLLKTSMLMELIPPGCRHWTQISTTWYTSTPVLMPWSHKCLEFYGDRMEVWSVPSVPHVPCIHQNWNKVLSIRVLLPIF